MTVTFLKVSLYVILFPLSSISLQLSQILLSIILLKNIFTIYLPGNFLLSNSHSFFLCCYDILTLLISSSPYFFSNFFTNFFMFSEFSTPFQVSSSTVYSFQIFWFSVKCGLHIIIQDSEGVSWKSRTKQFCVIQEHGKWNRIIFSFSLYAILLQVTQVVYFRLRTGDLKYGKLLEGGKVCCH